MTDHRSPLGRRGFLQGFLGALTVMVGGLRNATASSRLSHEDRESGSSANAALAYLGLQAGDRVGAYRVLAVRGSHLGAIAVALSSETGRTFQVDVLARDARAGAANGVRNTQHSTVFLLNEGSGSSRSDETLGLGAVAVADWLSAREQAGHRAPQLLTHAERAARHPRGIYKILG